jgi:NTE family protein
MPTNATTGTRKVTAPPKPDKKIVNLALQGGGAHGAFSWGVLDRLMEEEQLAVEGISATSAGAMNACAFAYGHAIGGCRGARRVLDDFWRKTSEAAAFSPLQPSLLDRIAKNFALDFSPVFGIMDMMSRVLSPYEWNPFGLNPLKDVLNECIDFEVLRGKNASIKLFLSATNVRTGKIKVFDTHELCAEAALASACLPFMFQAVELAGEYYWDGGFMGNPAIFPLIYACDSPDVVIVHINPLERQEVPKTARDIMNRINEISFNSSLMREMRAISFVTKLIDDGKIASPDMKHMFIHSITAEEVMTRLDVNSKLNADWEFLSYLKDTGRAHADAWLRQNWEAIGERSSIDIRQQYL